jgi:hypothetical protein
MLFRQLVSRSNNTRNLIAIRALSILPPSDNPSSQKVSITVEAIKKVHQNIPLNNIHTTTTKSLPYKIHTLSAVQPSKSILQKFKEHKFIEKFGQVLELAVDMGLFLGVGMFMIVVLLNYPFLFLIAFLLFVLV